MSKTDDDELDDAVIEEPTDPTELELAQAQFGLPIEHLFMIDPLEVTESDLLMIAAHFRNTRFNHLKAMEKPKTVEKKRGPKLDAEATQKEISNIFNALFGDDE